MKRRYNAERGKYTRLVSAGAHRAPADAAGVEVIDMRQEFLETRKQATFSRALIDAVTERLENGEQSMLLLNRRGFSSFVACRACGERVECANCSVTLTYHRRDRRMLCHYCNYSTRGSGALPQVRQRIHPVHRGWARSAWRTNCTARSSRRPASRAWIATRSAASAITKPFSPGFRDGDYDILVGTQMIAKGHDIPNVTLVGIVSADIGLGLPDFRAAERTFQLLTQAAGRAGRGETPGIVLIQTINPDHYAIRCAAAQDYEAFYSERNRVPAADVLPALRRAGERDRPRHATKRRRSRAARRWDGC